VSPSWFVADLTVAEMACRRDDRTRLASPLSGVPIPCNNLHFAL